MLKGQDNCHPAGMEVKKCGDRRSCQKRGEPVEKMNERGEMCSHPADTWDKWIKTGSKYETLFLYVGSYFFSLSPLCIRYLMKSFGWNVVKWLNTFPFESSVCVLLFHDFRRKRAVMRRTGTDSKGERRKVCLFFFPFVYFDNSDLPFSLCRRLSASVSLYRYSLFVFSSPEIPWWWFSLLILFKLPAFCFTCCKLSFTLSCPFIFVCVCVLCFSSCCFLLIISLFDPQQNSHRNLISH